MWILVFLNGMGLLSGLLSQKLAMYIIFAISFLFFFVMACIFWGVVHKVGQWCGVIAVVQCIVFQIGDYLQKKTNKKLEILVCFIAELLICVGLCLG